MAKKFSLTGTDRVIANLNQAVADIKGKSLEGQFEAGEKVLALAKKRVPVEYGELRESGFVARRTAEHHGVVIGFRAPYAIYVHENMEQKLKGQPRPSGIGVYWGPSGQPKYLESVINELAADGTILKTIQRRAKIEAKKR